MSIWSTKMKLDFELNVNRSILNETELAAINTLVCAYAQLQNPMSNVRMGRILTADRDNVSIPGRINKLNNAIIKRTCSSKRIINEETHSTGFWVAISVEKVLFFPQHNCLVKPSFFQQQPPIGYIVNHNMALRENGTGKISMVQSMEFFVVRLSEYKLLNTIK